MNPQCPDPKFDSNVYCDICGRPFKTTDTLATHANCRIPSPVHTTPAAEPESPEDMDKVAEQFEQHGRPDLARDSRIVARALRERKPAPECRLCGNPEYTHPDADCPVFTPQPEPTAESAEPTHDVSNGPETVHRYDGRIHQKGHVHDEVCEAVMAIRNTTIDGGIPILQALLDTAKAEGRREGADDLARNLDQARRSQPNGGLAAYLDEYLDALKGDIPDEA